MTLLPEIRRAKPLRRMDRRITGETRRSKAVATNEVVTRQRCIQNSVLEEKL
jgi:hypothetical protein